MILLKDVLVQHGDCVKFPVKESGQEKEDRKEGSWLQVQGENWLHPVRTALDCGSGVMDEVRGEPWETVSLSQILVSSPITAKPLPLLLNM